MDGYLDSYIKTTPFFLHGSNIDLDNIGNTLSNYMYILNDYPSEGFFPFINDDDFKDNTILKMKLKNGLTILPFRMRYDIIDTRKRKGLTISKWEEMPLSWKHITKNSDAIIIDDEKKLVLVSQIWIGVINHLKKHFFEHQIFADNKYNFISASPDFQFSSDLIKWLCYKYLRKSGKLNNLEITDISKVNVIIENTKHEANYKGEGVLNSWDEIKLSIKNKRVFYKMNIGLKYNNEEYEFQINRDGQTELSIHSCTSYRVLPKKDRTIHLISDIYKFIIPEIKTNYYSDKAWEKQERVSRIG